MEKTNKGLIKSWFYNLIKEAVVDVKNSSEISLTGNRNYSINELNLKVGSMDELDSTKGIKFTVHKANGGKIIETSRIDNIRERHIRSLYIVTDDQDFGKEINKIITMESLK